MSMETTELTEDLVIALYLEGRLDRNGQLGSSLLPISLTCTRISRMNLEVNRNITMITMCLLNERSMVPENPEITSCKDGMESYHEAG